MDKKQGGGVMVAFFAKPTIAKAAPAYGVTAAEFCGFSLNDVLIMLTIIYTLLLLLNALPGAWNGVKFLLNAHSYGRLSLTPIGSSCQPDGT